MYPLLRGIAMFDGSRGRVRFVLLGSLILAPLPLRAQESARVGEVKGEGVYVRSMPSQNAYPLMKLNAGQRVQIVREEFGWCEIIPPEGSFSLISGEYIDTADGKNGVVNADNVHVRAGSSLNSQRSKIQLKLSRGAEVTILGEDKGGYYRIAPPPGATAWIHSDFVSIGGESPAKSAADAPKGASANKPDPKEGPKNVMALSGDAGGSGDSSAAVEGPTEGLAALPASPDRDALIEADEALKRQLELPVGQRNLAALLPTYSDIAARAQSDYERRYAELRLEQVQRYVDLKEAVGRLREMAERALQTRPMPPLPPAERGPDIEGYLALSSLYATSLGPKRYRIVDQPGREGRSLAYIEVAADQVGVVEPLLGQRVRVFARERRLLPGLANALPLLIVEHVEQATASNVKSEGPVNLAGPRAGT